MMQPRIMVIHTDYLTAKNIQNRLKHNGYDVPDVVFSIDEALDRVDDTKPDLVLLDAEIKGSLDSLEIAHNIENCHHIPVVLLSTTSDHPSVHRWGYYFCSYRPTRVKEMFLTIDLILARHHFGKRLSEQEQMLTEIMRNSRDAVITVEAGEHITFMNSVAEQLTGWSYTEAADRSCGNILKIVEKNGGNATSVTISSLFEMHACVDLTNHLLVTRNGREVPVDFRATQINGRNGTASKMLLILRKNGSEDTSRD